MFDDYDEDDLFEEAMDYGLFDEIDYGGSRGSRGSGSCLTFLICMGAMVAVPIALFAHFVLV